MGAASGGQCEAALARHDEILRERWRGTRRAIVGKTTGDGVHAAFMKPQMTRSRRPSAGRLGVAAPSRGGCSRPVRVRWACTPVSRSTRGRLLRAGPEPGSRLMVGRARRTDRLFAGDRAIVRDSLPGRLGSWSISAPPLRATSSRPEQVFQWYIPDCGGSFRRCDRLLILAGNLPVAGHVVRRSREAGYGSRERCRYSSSGS